MGNRELLLSNFGGFKEIAVFDDSRPDDLLIKTLQEAEPYIQRAKMLSELNPGKEFRHAMVIPPGVLDQAAREGWFNDKARWKKFANDPDNAYLRTWPGRL